MQSSLKPLALAIHATTPACAAHIRKEVLEMEWIARHLHNRFPDDYRQARANIKS